MMKLVTKNHALFSVAPQTYTSRPPILDTEPSSREFFIKNILHKELAPVLRGLQLTPEELVAKINQRVEWYSGDEILDLRGAEYRHFISGVDSEYADHEFEIRNERV